MCIRNTFEVPMMIPHFKKKFLRSGEQSNKIIISQACLYKEGLSHNYNANHLKASKMSVAF